MTEADKNAQFETEALVHLDALYGLALRLTGGDAARSEDLVQEAVLKAYRAWDDFKLGTNCRAWLMTILRNTFINEFRSEQRRPSAVEFEEVADRSVFAEVADDDPVGGFFERIIDREVIAAIDDLPEEFRVPVVLSDLEGLSYQEISEILGIPVGTVKSRLFRARKRLQARLYTFAREMGYVS
jgi:RNA polymerase sigma-70 factor (ECF subfamily)